MLRQVFVKEPEDGGWCAKWGDVDSPANGFRNIGRELNFSRGHIQKILAPAIHCPYSFPIRLFPARIGNGEECETVSCDYAKLPGDMPQRMGEVVGNHFSSPVVPLVKPINIVVLLGCSAVKGAASANALWWKSSNPSGISGLRW